MVWSDITTMTLINELLNDDDDSYESYTIAKMYSINVKFEIFFYDLRRQRRGKKRIFILIKKYTMFYVVFIMESENR